MLQQQGVINGILVWLGILSDDGRLQWFIMKQEHLLL